jgi:anti-sigma factor RsiW
VTCRELSEFLQDYIAGELPDNVANEFAGHLVGCGNCEVYIEQYRQAVVLGRTLLSEGETEAPEELVRAIVDSLRAAG